MGTRPKLLDEVSARVPVQARPVQAGFARARLVKAALSREALLCAALGLMVFAPAAGCAPKASAVPLGLGPLALAERDDEAQADLKRRRETPKRPARTAVADRKPAADTGAAAEPSAVTQKPETDEGDDASVASQPGSVVFEGLYAGADVAVYRWTGYPEREEKDDKAKIRIEKPAAGSVSITLINTADGSDLCELTARVEGNTALIEPGQPCFGDGSELTSGRAVIEGDQLEMDAEGTLSGGSPEQDQEADGQLTYSFKGQRQ